ncbi:MAG: HAD-IB family phosphatase [Gaiellales bacterium]
MLLALDFDGTLATHDTVDWFSARWAPEDFEAADAALARGEITLDDCLQAQIANITATREEVTAFLVDTVAIRPGARELFDFCALHGIEPVVVSAGFASLIHAILHAHGFDLPVSAHEVDFTPDGMRVRFRERLLCDRCGERCKRDEVAALARGRRVAYVGDGYSDLCAAEDAELRFARAGLVTHLEAEGCDYLPFENMHDVRVGLADALGVAPSPGR